MYEKLKTEHTCVNVYFYRDNEFKRLIFLKMPRIKQCTRAVGLRTIMFWLFAWYIIVSRIT